MMMRKKTKMAWSVALSAAMAAGLLAGFCRRYSRYQ